MKVRLIDFYSRECIARNKAELGEPATASAEAAAGEGSNSPSKRACRDTKTAMPPSVPTQAPDAPFSLSAAPAAASAAAVQPGSSVDDPIELDLD